MATVLVYAWDATTGEWVKVAVASDGKLKLKSG
jgi:hypothetical protein